ncbi:MAG: T9SS type A sorting domain-containing protein, partial [Ignavibacteriaceae bacterium]|nr:T9SS type A sorting domain-containing protein [Ignavibacteriaceae bacterium]
PQNSLVSLKVYDVLGNEVANLVDAQQSAGRYEVTFDGSNLASGIYLYKIKAGNFTSTKKLVLMK